VSSAQLFSISRLALVGGAAAFIVHLVARSLLTAGADPVSLYNGSLWVPINLLGVLGAALVLLGLPGLCARMAGPTGWLGLIGVVLIALSWMFLGLFLSLFSVLVAPWLADQAPSLIAAGAPLPVGVTLTFLASLTAESVGTVLLAIPFLRGRMQPGWMGILLPVSALLTVVGNVIAPSGPATNAAINLLSNLGPMLLLVALATLGLRMKSKYAPAQPA
jgi:hypothetical protein